MDRIGRRPTAMLYAGAAGAFAIGAFQVSSHIWMLVLLLGTAWFGVGVAPVLSAMAAELFPTDIRAEASAWIRNIGGNTGSVIGPALVGVLGTAGLVVPALAAKAELARIGRYYATESMLVLDPATGRYDAQATPSTGSETLFDYYDHVLGGAPVAALGDHAVF
jgi:MFS family permease